MTDITPHQQRFMDRAIALALEAEADGNLPIGAVIVLGDEEIVGQGKNAIIMPTYAPGRHAEMEALRSVPADLWGRASEMVCYTTLEPCMMCMGGLLLHGIGKVIFGAADVLGGSGPAPAHLPEYYTATRRPPQLVGALLPALRDAVHTRAHHRLPALPCLFRFSLPLPPSAPTAFCGASRAYETPPSVR